MQQKLCENRLLFVFHPEQQAYIYIFASAYQRNVICAGFLMYGDDQDKNRCSISEMLIYLIA